MTELLRVRSKYLDQSPPGYSTSEMRKYRHAYQTPNGRWYIERAYGACTGGWYITDTTGEYTGCRCCWRSSDDHLTKEPTLAMVKLFLAEMPA